MKKSNILIAVFAVLAATSIAKADEIKVNFDGDAFEGQNFGGFQAAVAEAESQTTADILPVPVSRVVAFSEQEINSQILKVIKSGKQNHINGAIVDALGKLLAYGTKDEKRSFMESRQYMLPQRLAQFGNVDVELFLAVRGTRRPQTNCWEDNCRTQRVCNRRQECEDVTEIVCTAISVTGILTGDIPAAAAGEICKPVTHHLCKLVDDCADVEVCDTHCETINTSNGDTVDGNGNVVAYQ